MQNSASKPLVYLWNQELDGLVHAWSQLPQKIKDAIPTIFVIRREQIVAAAMNCVTRHGLHKATAAAIAKEAGFSEGQLHRYFDSKEVIIAAISKSVIAFTFLPIHAYTHFTPRMWRTEIEDSIKPNTVKTWGIGELCPQRANSTLEKTKGRK